MVLVWFEFYSHSMTVVKLNKKKVFKMTKQFSRHSVSVGMHHRCKFPILRDGGAVCSPPASAAKVCWLPVVPRFLCSRFVEMFQVSCLFPNQTVFLYVQFLDFFPYCEVFVTCERNTVSQHVICGIHGTLKIIHYENSSIVFVVVQNCPHMVIGRCWPNAI